MLKKILIGVAALIVVFLVVVIAQPSTYHVERSAVFAAPAEVIFAEVSDFTTWKEWSHWEKSDPTQKSTFSGEPGTVGHANRWVGEKTGKGTMTITATDKPNRVDMELLFVEPMPGTAQTSFVLTPEGDGTKVTWDMDGENDFMGKLFSLLMDMDAMIGGAYEEGLANLKPIVEEKAKKQAEAMAAAEPSTNAVPDGTEPATGAASP